MKITITSRNHKHQNTYSGYIYQSDFSTYYTSGNMAERIEKDLQIGKCCKKDVEKEK